MASLQFQIGLSQQLLFPIVVFELAIETFLLQEDALMQWAYWFVKSGFW